VASGEQAAREAARDAAVRDGARGLGVRDGAGDSGGRDGARRAEGLVLKRFPRPARVAGYLALCAFALLYLLPFLIEIATSFKTDPDAAAHPMSLVPSDPTVSAYRRLFGGAGGAQSVPFLHWLGNSALIAVVVTAGRVAFDSTAGYALARLRFPGRRVLFVFLLSAMAVPPVVLLIPKFLVLKTFGMFDSYPGMITPLLVDTAGVFILKQFFERIPREIEEAARVDGAGVLRVFWSVVLPMSRPALITLTVLSFQGSWNEFTSFLVSAQSSRYDTLTTGLAHFVSGGLGTGTQYPLKLTAAVLSTVPVAVLFFCFQRYYVRGANSGSVKE
jgi:multiple sugar transport system permease protein